MDLEIKEPLEDEFSIRLPEAYKNFLFLNNGGISSSSDELFEDAVFYAVGESSIRLDWEIGDFVDDGGNPHLKIPIGHTNNEDRIYLTNTGEIEVEGEIVANSFEEMCTRYLKRQ